MNAHEGTGAARPAFFRAQWVLVDDAVDRENEGGPCEIAAEMDATT